MNAIEQAKEILIEGVEHADSPEKQIMAEALALLDQFQNEQAAKGIEAMGFKKAECISTPNKREPELLAAEGTYGKIFSKAKATQPPTGEFTKDIRNQVPMERANEKSAKGWLCCKLFEACDRLDAQQQEIEKLKVLNDAYEEKIERYDGEIDKLTADYKKLELSWNEATKKVDTLTAENKARAERIEKLEDLLQTAKGTLIFSAGRFEHFNLAHSEIDTLVKKIEQALGKS